MITQLKFVSIPVSDQDRALAFYTDKLGFEISTDQPMGPGKRWIELRVAMSSTRVVLFTMDGQEDASARSSTAHSPAITWKRPTAS